MRTPSPPRLPLAKFFARVARRSAPYKLVEGMTLRLDDCHRRHAPRTRGEEARGEPVDQGATLAHLVWRPPFPITAHVLYTCGTACIRGPPGLLSEGFGRLRQKYYPWQNQVKKIRPIETIGPELHL